MSRRQWRRLAGGLLAVVLGGCAAASPSSTLKVPGLVKLHALVLQPPRYTSSSLSVALTGARWKLSNGKALTPTAGDTTFSFQSLDNAVVGFRIPTTAPTWYEYAVLHHAKGRWSWTGAADMPWTGPYDSSSRGVSLPFTPFLRSALTPAATSHETFWIFEHRAQAIIVIRQPEYPTSMADYHRIGSTNVYWRREASATVVVGISVGEFITVAGPFSERTLLRVFNSLPLPSSGLFPFSS